jgi:hypothetical protein
MRKGFLFSVILVLLQYSCTLAVGQAGSVLWTNWASMPGGPSVSFVPRSAEQGPSNQHQQIDGSQLAYAINGQSNIFQTIAAAGEQSQDVTDTSIQQHQNGSMLINQIAEAIGAGQAGGIQNFVAQQNQAASSAIGQSSQNTLIVVTQDSNVFGDTASNAIAVGNIVVSTSQTTYVN